MRLPIAVLGAFCIAGLSACATIGSEGNSTKFLAQYSTLKLIEQASEIDAQRVMDAVERIRTSAEEDQQIEVVNLKDWVLADLDIEGMDMSTQLAVITLVDGFTKDYLVAVDTEFLGPEERVSLHQYLDWVEQAARMAR